MKHGGSKLKDSADSSLVNNAELVSGSAQVSELDKNPQILGGAPGDAGDVCRPAEVTGDGDAEGSSYQEVRLDQRTRKSWGVQ